MLILSGRQGRVYPSPQSVGQRGKEEESSGEGERGAEGPTAGPGGRQTGPAAGDRQGRIKLSELWPVKLLFVSVYLCVLTPRGHPLWGLFSKPFLLKQMTCTS